MNSQDIHSVTDLRSKSKEIIERGNTSPQFIMKNNKMVWVMISPSTYDLYFEWEDTYTPDLKDKYEVFLEDHKQGDSISLEQLKEMMDV
jgi:PHD/YefM family antitoxin component YafN of YafNO toxin-antitoxin module